MAQKQSTPKQSNLELLKYEVAKENGIPLSDTDNGNLTARQCGTVGGNMVKKVIEQYKAK